MGSNDLSRRKQRLLIEVHEGRVVRAQVEPSGVRWRITETDADRYDRAALTELAEDQLIEVHGFNGGSTAAVTLTEAGQDLYDAEREGA